VPPVTRTRWASRWYKRRRSSAAITGTLVPLSDAGAASDALTLSSIGAPLSDAGAGADSLAVPTVAFLPGEAGTGADSLAVVVTVKFGDAGLASDGAALFYPVSDAGSATESMTVEIEIAGIGSALMSTGGPSSSASSNDGDS